MTGAAKSVPSVVAALSTLAAALRAIGPSTAARPRAWTKTTESIVERLLLELDHGDVTLEEDLRGLRGLGFDFADAVDVAEDSMVRESGALDREGFRRAMVLAVFVASSFSKSTLRPECEAMAARLLVEHDLRVWNDVLDLADIEPTSGTGGLANVVVSIERWLRHIAGDVLDALYVARCAFRAAGGGDNGRLAVASMSYVIREAVRVVESPVRCGDPALRLLTHYMRGEDMGGVHFGAEHDHVEISDAAAE